MTPRPSQIERASPLRASRSRFVVSAGGQGYAVSSLLAIYLRDHHAAGVAGARLARRAALSVNSGNAELSRVAAEIGQELVVLEDIMRRLGVQPDHVKDRLARIAERLGRLKLNGRLSSRSPLSDLLELEALVVGITGKQALWVSLREIPSIGIDELDRLIERAENQKRVVETARVAAAKRSLPSAGTPPSN